MIHQIIRSLIVSVRATVVLALLTGLLFPVAVTAVAQLLFPQKANGSLIKNGQGTVIGSGLIGQQFSAPEYFHPRPSAAGSGYAGEASGGSNLGPASSKMIYGVEDNVLTEGVNESFAGSKQLAEQYRSENGIGVGVPVPVDAVTRSASGLDPDISLNNARLQSKRIAEARGVSPKQVLALIEKAGEPRQLGIFGEPRLNVLRANLAMDAEFGTLKTTLPPLNCKQN